MTILDTLNEMRADGLSDHLENLNQMYIAWLESHPEESDEVKRKVKLTHYRLKELTRGY